MSVFRPTSLRHIVLSSFFACGVLLGLTPSAAAAETALVSSEPGNGAELITSPTQIVATFDAAVPNKAVMTMACAGIAVPLGSVTIGSDAVSLVAPVSAPLPVGICTVSFSIPETDGKVTFGSFSFTILDPTDPGSSTSAGSTTASSSNKPPVSGPLGLVRVLSYAAIAALFGGAIIILLYWPEGFDYEETRNYFRIAWFLAMISTYFTAALRAALVAGKPFVSTLSPFGWGELVHNVSDISLVLRVLLVAASFILVLRPEGLLDPQSRATSISFPTLAVVTLGFTRVYNDISIVGIVAGTIHALTVSIWFGGLLFLVRTVVIGPGDQDLVHAVRGFSRLSAPVLVLAIASGFIQLLHLDGGALLSSRHGRLILFKALGVGAMFYVGSATRQYVARNLTKKRELTSKVANRLRGAITTEILFGLFVLVVTSWSVATLPARVTPPGADTLSYAFVGDRSGGAFDVQVRVTPAKVGFNAVRIDVFSPDAGISDLKVQFVPPTSSSSSVILNVPLSGVGGALLPLAEGIPLGEPGLWTVTVTATGPQGPLPKVTYTINVTADGLTSLIDPNASTTLPDPNEQSTIADGSAAPQSTVVTLAPTTTP